MNRVALIVALSALVVGGVWFLSVDEVWEQGDKVVLVDGVRGCFVIVFDDPSAALEHVDGFNVLTLSKPDEIIRTSSRPAGEGYRRVVVDRLDGGERELELGVDVELDGAPAWWSGQCLINPICVRDAGAPQDPEWQRALAQRVKDHPELFACDAGQ